MSKFKRLFAVLMCVALLATATACGNKHRQSVVANSEYLHPQSEPSPAVASPSASPVSYSEPSSTPQPTQTPIPIVTPSPTPIVRPTPSAVPTPTQFTTPTPVPTPQLMPINTTEATPGWVSGNSVNVRSLPGTSASIIGGANKDDPVTVLGSSNGWTKVLINGMEGYIASNYVTTIPPASSMTTPEDIHVTTGEYLEFTGTSDISAIRSLILQYTNNQRTSAGLSALNYDSTLQSCADTRAVEQATLFSHTRPNGTDWSTAFPTGAGYYYYGENLGNSDRHISDSDFASEIVNSWMSSPTHRANIMNSNYSCIAIGVYISGNNMYAVQEFGGFLPNATVGGNTGYQPEPENGSGSMTGPIIIR